MSNEAIDVFSAMEGNQGVKVKDLDVKTRESIDRLQSGLEVGGAQERMKDALDRTEKELEEAVSRGVTEEEIAEIRKGILEANLKSVREKTEAEQKDLAMAVYGMSGLLEKIGEGYVNLGKEHPDDVALIEAAKEAVAELESEIAETKKKMNFFWRRDRKLAELEPALEKAKQEVPEAEAEAKRRARRRLQEASIEDTLQEYQARTDTVLQIMRQSHKSGKEKLEIVSDRKAEAFRQRDESMEALEQWEEKVQDLETNVREEEEKLSMLESGTSEYSEQQTRIAGIKQELEKARVSRNNALVKSNSKAEYSEELELDEVAIQRLIGNLEAWIIQLQSALEERMVTFQARLEAEKLLADQDAASQIDKVGSQVDQNNRNRMAQAAAAADKARQAMLADMPNRRKRMAETKKAFAKHIGEARERDAEFLKNFQDEFGIDPLTLSEFYEDVEKEEAVAAS